MLELWSYGVSKLELWGLKVHIFKFKGVVIGFEEFRSSYSLPMGFYEYLRENLT